MEAAARLLRPLKRGKPGKGGDTSPRRGLRNRPSRENSATSGSISTVEEGEVTSSRSVPNLNAGITRTSSLPRFAGEA